MNPLFFSLAMPLSSLPQNLQRPPEGIGVGVYMGSPTGLAAVNVALRKKKITQQAYVSWNFSTDNFRLVVDQVWELLRASRNDGTSFPVYAGGRVWAQFNNFSQTLGFTGYSNAIGVGLPIGAIYQHEEVAIEGYIEVTPAFQIAPSTAFGLQAGVGIRFYPSF